MIYEDHYNHDKFNEKNREQGKDFPTLAHTMIGLDGLNNIQFCIEEILKNNITGDFIETGVWRGGASIFMRAVLKEHKINDKAIWVADSFEGLPKTDYAYDRDFNVAAINKMLAISLETVQNNFRKYDLLDNQVKFLKGWFKDTLPRIPTEQQFALIRLDGDFYESTIQALDNLYPKLSVGGYVIIDDYGAMKTCASAVNDYRKMHDITDKIESAGWSIRFWKKTK